MSSVVGLVKKRVMALRFWCLQYDIKLNSEEADITRAGIKRNQEKLHESMVECSSMKFHPGCVGDNVIIPIQSLDRMTSLS